MKDRYFRVQAKIGITKHPGGIEATNRLIQDCQITKGKKLLEIGCGAGTNTVYIAKRTGADITAIDLSPDMVETAKSKARKLKNVNFRVADAQKLPFKDNSFDIAISQSVTSFTKDKLKAIKEYKRVLKKGGFLGLIEPTWLHSKPPKDLVNYIKNVTDGCSPETEDKWSGLMKKAGLKEVIAHARKMGYIEQFSSEIRLVGFSMFGAWYRLIKYYLTDSEYRRMVNQMSRDAIHIPKGFMKNFGYGTYIAKKVNK